MSKTKEKPTMETFIDNEMILFVTGRIRYNRAGIPCTIRRDDFFAEPTEGEIACVKHYADVLVDKVAYLRKWAKRAEKLRAEDAK